MKKIIINEEVYLNYYNIGLSDTKIAKLMSINNSVLSKFRNDLKLKPNRPKFTTRHYATLNIDNTFKQVLIGSIIGDGSLELDTESHAKNARLRFGHCIAQQVYLQTKIDMLPGLWKSPIRLSKTKVEISSISHPILTDYYNQFYINKIKILPFNTVKTLDCLGLSIIFMDDGSYDKTTNSLYISLCNFTKEENEFFIGILKTNFDIDASIINKGKIGAKYKNIYIKARSRERFKEIIRPYLISSMLYKIGE